MKTALLLGASGFIGSFLLEELLASGDYARVTAVARRGLQTTHPKLNVLIGDRSSLPELKDRLIGDDVFIAMGTTRKATPDREEYVKIDRDFPLLFARLARENGARAVFMVTAVGADPRSRFFYTRLKGEIERDLSALGFARTHLFRPSMLLGNRSEHRPLEKTIQRLWPATDALLRGPLSIYRGIHGKDVAKAMVRAAAGTDTGLKIHHYREMTSPQ